uniref:Putative secreted protein n=1 Tax=Anopheles darlingi TaxID=43151 RepID=A0A2M4D6J2_ANODA
MVRSFALLTILLLTRAQRPFFLIRTTFLCYSCTCHSYTQIIVPSSFLARLSFTLFASTFRYVCSLRLDICCDCHKIMLKTRSSQLRTVIQTTARRFNF